MTITDEGNTLGRLKVFIFCVSRAIVRSVSSSPVRVNEACFGGVIPVATFSFSSRGTLPYYRATNTL